MFAYLDKHNLICKCIHTCKCTRGLTDGHTQSMQHTSITENTCAATYTKKALTNYLLYDTFMHMLLLPYAICLSHTHTRWVRRQTILSPTHSHVQLPSLFPWKPEEQGANERLCDCLTVKKCSPVPASTAARWTQSSGLEFMQEKGKLWHYYMMGDSAK